MKFSFQFLLLSTALVVVAGNCIFSRMHIKRLEVHCQELAFQIEDYRDEIGLPLKLWEPTQAQMDKNSTIVSIEAALRETLSTLEGKRGELPSVDQVEISRRRDSRINHLKWSVEVKPGPSVWLCFSTVREHLLPQDPDWLSLEVDSVPIHTGVYAIELKPDSHEVEFKFEKNQRFLILDERTLLVETDENDFYDALLGSGAGGGFSFPEFAVDHQKLLTRTFFVSATEEPFTSVLWLSARPLPRFEFPRLEAEQ